MQSRTSIDHNHDTPSQSAFSADLMQERDKRTQAEGLNKAVLSSIGDGVIIIDEYGIITNINDSAGRILGYKTEELTGQWLQKVLPSKDIEGKDMPLENRPAMRALISGHAESAVTSYIKKDGSIIQVAGTAAPFILDGVPKGAVIVFRDFTREVAASRAKDEFISLTSHQLRTPLTAIMMYAKMIKAEESVVANPDAINYLKKIELSATGMLELIDDFLNISKLELGKFEPNYQLINIVDLIKEQIERLDPVFRENDIDVKFVKPKEIPEIMTDPQLVREIVHNLLTNSIRYRREADANIKVSIKVKNSCVIIAIKDNGIGIPKDSQEKIFSRLYRADNAKKVQVHGTGLGLYLVKKMTDSISGDIWLSSSVGVGTTFYVQLPR